MRIRSVRSLPVAVAVVAAATGSLSWAPPASAQSPDPTTSTSTSPAPRNPAEADTGGVTILTKDPAGDVLAGAAFTLIDFEGKGAASGKTSADGQLAFEDLAPGVYRLKEISSGSKLHDTADDQDVIITPGTDAPLTIIDPFKPASLLLQAKDSRSGKLLAGTTVNIGSGDKTLLTLTTGARGTATAKLPLDSRTGTDFWVKAIKAPAGYDLDNEQRDFKAKPGDRVTVTIINVKTHTTVPSPAPSAKPPHTPTDTPPGKPGHDSSPTPPKPPFLAPTAAEPASSTTAPLPSGTLAHTGAGATPWLLGGAGLLIAAGGGVLVAARRRRTDDSDENSSRES